MCKYKSNEDDLKYKKIKSHRQTLRCAGAHKKHLEYKEWEGN